MLKLTPKPATGFQNNQQTVREKKKIYISPEFCTAVEGKLDQVPVTKGNLALNWGTLQTVIG
jgi:hypothetical protein